jgi:hypothetical protein
MGGEYCIRDSAHVLRPTSVPCCLYELAATAAFRLPQELVDGSNLRECRVYLSAFNHADTEVILRAVDQAPWIDRQMVQVFVKEQEEEVFLLRYSGGSTQKRPWR